MRYAMVGATSGELLTFEGAVLVHDDRAELEWLFPHGARVIEFPRDGGMPTMPVADHPQLANIRWPLNRAHFVAT